MAVCREQAECPICGEPYKVIPLTKDPDFIGDNFVGWDISGHKCKGKNPAKTKLTASDVLEDNITRLGSYEWRNFKGFTDYGAKVNPKIYPATLDAMEQYAKQEKIKMLESIIATTKQMNPIGGEVVILKGLENLLNTIK